MSINAILHPVYASSSAQATIDNHHMALQINRNEMKGVKGPNVSIQITQFHFHEKNITISTSYPSTNMSTSQLTTLLTFRLLVAPH